MDDQTCQVPLLCRQRSPRHGEQAPPLQTARTHPEYHFPISHLASERMSTPPTRNDAKCFEYCIKNTVLNLIVNICVKMTIVCSPSLLSSVRAEVFHHAPRGPESHSTACCLVSSLQPPRQPPQQQRVYELLCRSRSPATPLRYAGPGPRHHGMREVLAHARHSTKEKTIDLL